MSFDYETETSDEAIRAVVAEIKGAPLKPLSPDEQLERERWGEDGRGRQNLLALTKNNTVLR
jgi:hypothetical protein